MAAATDYEGEVAVGVTAFGPRSLALIQAVASGRLGRVVLTRRGRPIAALVPLVEEPKELWGALAGIMEPVAGVDLGAPTGERWKREFE
jgi:antitoxin (DNA-binding transcriptional repressor) of toxin-antitoxin stability system